MNKLKLIFSIIIFSITIISFSQTAPKGKKTLEVKESYQGEYMQEVTQGDLSKVVIESLEKRIPKKLKPYGFDDITITAVGKAKVPVSLATKMGSLVSNESLGKAQLEMAKTSSEIHNAVDKIYEKEDNTDNNWKFQANFIDNSTKEEFKVRLNMSYNPKYIIKRSDTIINLRG